MTEKINEQCWVEGCSHSYEAEDLKHLVRAAMMHLESDHRGSVEELVYLD